jgi:hypothetical protein
VYHNGRITSLAPINGGHGLMSGLMHDGEFYYTYSSGAGIHRAHVGKLQVSGGTLKHWNSVAFWSTDLFVSDAPGKKVQVLVGDFKAFNHWETGRPVGLVRQTSRSEIQVVSPKGEVLAPTFRLSTPKGQQERVYCCDAEEPANTPMVEQAR